MKTVESIMLGEIVNGEVITIGSLAKIYRYSDGGIVARMNGSGLTSGEFALRQTGIRLVMQWIVENH